LLIKYIKSVLWRAAKLLSYIEDARCPKVKLDLKEIACKDTGCVYSAQGRVKCLVRFEVYVKYCLISVTDQNLIRLTVYISPYGDRGKE